MPATKKTASKTAPKVAPIATPKTKAKKATNGKAHAPRAAAAPATLPKRGDRVSFVTTGRNGRMPARTGKVISRIDAPNGYWFEIRPDSLTGGQRSGEPVVKVRPTNLQVIAG